MPKTKISTARARKEFEANNVYKRTELKKLQTTGYEAYRVSPQTTTKFGQKYRKIYGATISPDYKRGTQGKYGAKVEWYPHGYTTEKTKAGTRLLQPLTAYPVNKEEAKRKLMLKKRKTTKRK